MRCKACEASDDACVYPVATIAARLAAIAVISWCDQARTEVPVPGVCWSYTLPPPVRVRVSVLGRYLQRSSLCLNFGKTERQEPREIESTIRITAAREGLGEVLEALNCFTGFQYLSG